MFETMMSRAPEAFPHGVFSNSQAMRYELRRSWAMPSRMPGRCTFTTASRPSRRVQAWTCPIDADAIGTRSKRAKTWSGAPPSSSRTTPCTSS